MSDHVENLRRGFNWLGGASVVARLIDFSTVLIMLALLTKAQIGAASLVLSVAMVIEAVIDIGIGSALLQTPQTSDEQLGSAHWLVLTNGLLLGILTLILAPAFEAAYAIPGMALLFVPIALKQPLVAGSLISLTLLNRALQYERIALINVVATLCAALVRLGLALFGAGSWALIVGFSAHAIFVLIGAQISTPFWPRRIFVRSAIRPLLRFGLNAAASNAFQQLFRNVDFLLIGWLYGPADLAVYRLAFDIAMEPAVAVGDLINRTSVPVFVRAMSVREHLRPAYLWSLRRLVTIVAPLMAALALIATPLTGLINDPQGQNYAAAAIPLKILVMAALLRVVLQTHYPLLLADGRAFTALRLSAVTLVLLSSGILLAGLSLPASSGIIAVSWVWLAVYPALLTWTVRDLGRVMQVRLRDLLSTIAIPATGAIMLILLSLSLSSWLDNTDPHVQIAVIAAITMLIYAAIALYARQSRTEDAGIR